MMMDLPNASHVISHVVNARDLLSLIVLLVIMNLLEVSILILNALAWTATLKIKNRFVLIVILVAQDAQDHSNLSALTVDLKNRTIVHLS